MNNPEPQPKPLPPAPGSAAPFTDRQRVSLDKWDKHSPPRDRMGDCIVVNQENGPDHCESGWMITVRSKDGTTIRLDSHWMKPNTQAER
jgi:hypothetical protein